MCDFYLKLTEVCHNLLFENPKLLSYLKERRDLSDETIRKYRLGAFPKDLRSLYKKNGLSAESLKKHDIIWNADQSAFKLYPLVIPIRNAASQPIAIGCRTLLTENERKEKGIPKYRNSVYKKTSYLFGLEFAQRAIRKNDLVYVVEGYFDAITAHQNNYNNVVATCGTIFSRRQLLILSRYTNNICLLFDNDLAGKNCARRALDNLKSFEEEINVFCNFTPQGFKDLDEYLRAGEDMCFFNGGAKNA